MINEVNLQQFVYVFKKNLKAFAFKNNADINIEQKI